MKPSITTPHDEAVALLRDYDRFAAELIGEIKNLGGKMARNEPAGWEGSRRRGVYQPHELEQLRKRLASALYTP